MQSSFLTIMSFLLFPYKFIIDHRLRSNIAPNRPLGQPATAILVVVNNIYLDFRIIWESTLRSTEYSLNKTTKQEIERDNSGHLISWVHILQQVSATLYSQNRHPGFIHSLRNI